MPDRRFPTRVAPALALALLLAGGSSATAGTNTGDVAWDGEQITWSRPDGTTGELRLPDAAPGAETSVEVTDLAGGRQAVLVRQEPGGVRAVLLRDGAGGDPRLVWHGAATLRGDPGERTGVDARLQDLDTVDAIRRTGVALIILTRMSWAVSSLPAAMASCAWA